MTYKEQKFISHRTEAEKAKVMLPADLQSLFYKGTNSSHEGSAFMS